MQDKVIKTLKVGIIGEPNTGKSTLLNTLLEKKYSIVTRKAQTTIKSNSAVLRNADKQIIFTDTPGIITYTKNYKREIYKEASNVALEADVIFLLFNLKKDKVDKIKKITNYFESYELDLILLLNKIDLLLHESFIKKVSEIKDSLPNKIIFSVSGKKKLGINQIVDYLIKNKHFTNAKPFKKNDLSTDLSYLKEIVREKVIENIHDEIPFNLYFETDKVIVNKDNSVTVHISIILKKISYKPIIIGKKGENIKKISILARKDLEANLKRKFHLYLSLKILKKNYQKGN